jgi:DNA excision repair protein ERCC-4
MMMITISYHHTEGKSGIPDLLTEKRKESKYRTKVKVEENKGNEIDYIIGDTIGIERKSMDDLASSIQQNKIPSQLKRIVDNGLIPVFLVEGIFPTYEQSQMAWESVYGYISHISESGIVVNHTVHQEHSAIRLLNLALSVQAGKFGHLQVPVIKSKSDHPTLSRLMAIPTIGEDMAHRIRLKYKSEFHFLMDCYKQLKHGGTMLEDIDPRKHRGLNTARKIAEEVTKSW